jgi:hypothetical protein
MKRWLIDLLRRFIDQTCECGKFKPALADACFDCTIATRPKDPPVIIAPAACKCR